MKWEDHFDEYLAGTMDSDTLAALENDLKHDQALQDALANHRLAIEAVKRSSRKSLKNDMTAWNSQKNASSIYKLRWWFAAATLVGIAAMVYLGLVNDKSEKLYSQYYTTYPNVLSHRGEASFANKALELYSLREYKSFIEYLDKSKTVSDTLLLYKALSLMEMGDFYEASGTFSIINISITESIYGVKEYYWALCHLALNETAEAKAILQQLALLQGSSYATKAETLLQAINN